MAGEERHSMRAWSSMGRGARVAALAGLAAALVILAGCGRSSTVLVGARATATLGALPDPGPSPTALAVGTTAHGDPAQCSPASTVAPLPATMTTLYATGTDGTITALSASDGTTRWRYATGVSAMPTIVPSGDLVYATNGAPTAGSPKTLVALGAADGAVKWQARLPGSPSYGGGLPIQVAGGVVYVPGADGILRALDGATGAERWRYTVGGGIATVTVAGTTVYAQNYLTGGLVALRAGDGALLWRYATDANVAMAPVATSGLVYVAESATTLAALNANTGAARWRADLTAPYLAINLNSAAVAGTGLYVNAGHSIYALNAGTGALCWVAPSCGQQATSVPLLDGDTLYETCFGGAPGPGSPVACAAFAVNAHTGAARWTTWLHGFVHVTPASLANGLLYVNATQAQALRPESGAVAWRSPAQESQLGEVGLVVAGGVVYTSLADGTVRALGASDGAPHWSASLGATDHRLVAGA
jgi:outer membrane protein assembly factor BamB